MDTLPPVAIEVLALLPDLFASPVPEQLLDVRVTRSLAEVEAWLYTEANPGDANSSPNWLNLRERMLSTIQKHARATSSSPALRELTGTLTDRIERTLAANLPDELADFENDITADLVNAVAARTFAYDTEPDRFFGLLLDAYRAGFCPAAGRAPIPRVAWRSTSPVLVDPAIPPGGQNEIYC